MAPAAPPSGSRASGYSSPPTRSCSVKCIGSSPLKFFCGFCDSEVTKAIQARKKEKMQRREAELMERRQQQQRSSGADNHGVHPLEDGGQNDSQNTDQVENQQQKASKQSTGRQRHWRPTLQIIEEIGS
ncbi:hypothetical protein Cni_G28659 [Canna indica]|uniref:Uncharacterized protein n=1 Tax=Canna indica TaxID=4628 RepID=A0AAQ3L2W5_9LILI|nr:hypothetical protein Cni_G28659 [Canna indica]